MSNFPTKVLLATDGSIEADLAARTAAELADKTSSELHVVHVSGISPWYLAYPEATAFDGAELMDPVLEEDLLRISEQRARELLGTEVGKLRSAGGTLAQGHLAEGGVPQEIVGLAEEIGAGLIVMGSRGLGGIRRALMGSVSVQWCATPTALCWWSETVTAGEITCRAWSFWPLMAPKRHRPPPG
jgi:nucleotide-binding universal stress UspA family protein